MFLYSKKFSGIHITVIIPACLVGDGGSTPPCRANFRMLPATFFNFNPNQWSGSIPASSVMVAHRSQVKKASCYFRKAPIMVLEWLAKPSTGNGFGVRVPGLPPITADYDH